MKVTSKRVISINLDPVEATLLKAVFLDAIQSHSESKFGEMTRDLCSEINKEIDKLSL